MNIFRNRPLALGCAVFLLSLFISYYIPLTVKIIVLSLGVISFAILFAVCIKSNNIKQSGLSVKIAPACLLLAVSMAVSIITFTSDSEEKRYTDGKEHDVMGYVTGTEYESDYYCSYTANIYRIDGEKEDIDLVIHTNSIHFDEYDYFGATVSFGELRDSEYGYSEKEYYKSKGIQLSAECTDAQVLSHSSGGIKGSLQAVNDKLNNRLKEAVNEETYSLISAILLGNRKDLGSNVKRDFSRLGISHILALSGMHLTLLVSLLSLALNALNLSKHSKNLIMVSAILLYVCMTGFSKSCMRAGLMLILYCLLSVIRIKHDSITVLFVSVSIICALSPYSVFSVSLLLSFLSMLCCIIVSKLQVFRKIRKIRSKTLIFVISTVLTTVLINLSTLPVMFYCFGYISLISPIMNIIFIPLFSVLLYLSPFLLIFSDIPYISFALEKTAEFITKIILNLSGRISALKGIAVPLEGVAEYIGVLIVFVSLVVFLLIVKKKRIIPFVSLCVGISVLTVSLIVNSEVRKKQSSALIFNESGDIVTAAGNNELTVVNISNGNYNLADKSVCLAQENGFYEIENYVFTDYGTYIIQTFDRLSDKTIVRNLYLPKPDNEEEMSVYSEIAEIAERKKIGINTTERELTVSGNRFVFNEKNTLSRSDKRAVSFSLFIKNSRITYLGSSTFEILDFFADDYAAVSDVLVFGSYGPNIHKDYSYETKAEIVFFLGNSIEKAEKEFADTVKENAVILDGKAKKIVID